MGFKFNPFTGNFDVVDGVGANALLVETGSYSVPVVISGSITIPSDSRAQIYVKGDSSLTTITAIGDGADTQELYVIGTDDAAKVKMTALSNLVLSGEWYGAANSIIKLHWIASATKWIEVGRNEI